MGIIDEVVKEQTRKRGTDWVSKLSKPAKKDFDEIVKAYKEGKITNMTAAYRVFCKRNPDVSVKRNAFTVGLKDAAQPD